MKKLTKFITSVSVCALLCQTALPTAVVLADTTTVSTADVIIYSDESIILKLKEDSVTQKVVEEVNVVDGTSRTFTLDKADQSILISSDQGEDKYTKQELINVGSNELGYGSVFRSSNYGGFGSIGYNYSGGNYYLKITANGVVHDKNVRRKSSNAGYLDAFRNTVDDIVATEWSIVGSLGIGALGAFLTGGIGALSLLTSSTGIISAGNRLTSLTSRAHGYFWNV